MAKPTIPQCIDKGCKQWSNPRVNVTHMDCALILCVLVCTDQGKHDLYLHGTEAKTYAFTKRMLSSCIHIAVKQNNVSFDDFIIFLQPVDEQLSWSDIVDNVN